MTSGDVLHVLGQQEISNQENDQSMAMARLRAKECSWGEGAKARVRGPRRGVATQMLMGAISGQTLRRVLELLEGERPGIHPEPFFSWC